MARIHKVERKGGTAYRTQLRKTDGTDATRAFPTRAETKRRTACADRQIEAGRRVAANDNGNLRFGDLLDAYVTAHERHMSSRQRVRDRSRGEDGNRPCFDGQGREGIGSHASEAKQAGAPRHCGSIRIRRPLGSKNPASLSTIRSAVTSSMRS